MFYVEEDITPAVNAASNLFGRTGRFLTGKNVIQNASIATREFGKIWHGDIDANDYESRLTALSNRLKTAVYLFDATNGYNFEDAITTSNNSPETADLA